MDVVAPLVAHLQPPKAVRPRQRPFHHPTMPSQPLAGLNTAPGDARGYTPLTKRLAAARGVVGLVGVQLLRALARSATARLADRLDGVHDLLQDLRVVDVGRRVGHRQRDASSVYHNMALRALFALVRRIRAGLFCPPRGRPRSPSPTTPSPSRSRLPCPGDPRGFGAASPTRPPRATL